MPDALHVDAEPAADRDHQHRQRDRDPEPAFEHRVEKRVLGIGVVVEVAGEPFALEEVRAQRLEGRVGAPARRARRAAPSHGVDVEPGMRVRRDAERGDVERHSAAGAVHRRDESLAGLHRGRR